MCEFNCNACQHDPGLKKAWGCDGPTQGVVWDDRHGEVFLNCPLAFVTEDITEWYTEHTYDTEVGSPLNYREQSVKYIEAWMTYKTYYNKYQSYRIEKSKNQKQGDDLDAMAANLMAQKRNSQHGR